MAISNIRRVLSNSVIIYLKIILRIILGLFTTRIVLNALGQSDYGIFSLVAGIIGMLSFFQALLTNSSLRFLSHAMGSDDDFLIRKTYNITWLVSLMMGVFMVLLLEGFGYIMFKYFVNIPDSRVEDSWLVYHFMVATTFFNIFSVPYNAFLSSKENFLMLSLIQILYSVIGLLIALSMKVVGFDLLIFYGAAMFFNQLLSRIILQIYTLLKYKQCKIKLVKYWDLKLAKEILIFSGWNFFGVIGGVLRTKSTSLFLNYFFGVLLNTANGIAMSLTQQMNTFTASIGQAINPLIIKSEGSGKRQKMINLSILSAKYSIFVFSLVAIPAFLEMPYLLKLWLKNVPEYSVIFARIIILTMFIEKFTFQFKTVINAVGKIKRFTLTGFSIILLSLPVVFFLLKAGLPPYTVFIVGLVISIISGLVRIYFAYKLAGLDVKLFMRDVMYRGFIPVLLIIPFPVVCIFYIEEGFLRLMITSAVSFVTLFISVRLIGLDKEEFKKVKYIIRTILVDRKVIR